MFLFFCLFAGCLMVLSFWLLHRFFPKSTVPKEIAQVITMPVANYAKEYSTLRDRIKHAATRSELSVLEMQAIEFLNEFGEKVRDMFNDLTTEINIRSHILYIGHHKESSHGLG